MFCEESLGKIKWRAFRKHVGPSLESLITMEQLNTVLSGRKKKKRRILLSKTAMVGCCKLSLYANESCDEDAVYFRQ